MEQIILIIHVFVALGLIGLILLQQGKGAEVGASFGSGASQTLFGSQGSGNFLTRATAILITIFFVTSLALGFLATHRAKPKDLDELLKNVQPTTASPAQVQDDEVPEIVKPIHNNKEISPKILP
jgi:preprotein translocase subunit SecG